MYFRQNFDEEHTIAIKNLTNTLVVRKEFHDEFYRQFSKYVHATYKRKSRKFLFVSNFLEDSPNNEDKPRPKPFFKRFSMIMQHCPLYFLVLKTLRRN